MQKEMIKTIGEDYFAFKGIEGYYLFQTESFGIFKIDEKLYRKIDSLSESDAGGSEFPAEIVPLIEEMRLKAPVTGEIHNKVRARLSEPDPELTSINIFLTDRCNMRCRYCFTDDKPESLLANRRTIDLDTAISAVDFYAERMAGNDKPLSVNFFGGEPLLRYGDIKKIMQHTTELAERDGKNTFFYMTTNATLLDDEMIDFFNSSNFEIVVSLDGDRTVHDANRIDADGRGTFDYVFQMSKRLFEQFGSRVRIRTTVSPDNPDVQKIASFFRSSELYRYGWEMMYESDRFPDKLWDEQSLAAFTESSGRYYAELYSLIKSGDIHPVELAQLKIDLSRIKRKASKFTACQMGRESITIAPDGNFYSCHWLVGDESAVIGSPETGFTAARAESYPPAVFDNEDCRHCWARYLCGGGCPAVSRRTEARAVCIDRKTRWQGLLSLYAQLLSDGHELIEELVDV